MRLEQLTLQVTEIARMAGDFIRQQGKSFDPGRIEYKGFNDLVSYVDKTAEKMIVSELEKLLPAAGFITEEKTSSRVGERYNWIIDPLDGTTNFIHGLPLYSVSIALKDQNELISGVVYEINLDECFYACKDAPACLNGAEIHVSAMDRVERSLLATGFPYYDFGKQDAYIALFAELMRNCHGLRRIGSAAVDLVYTACGRFEAFYEYNLNPWDIAAGIIIVRQAGGDVVNFSGGQEVMDSRQVLATNGRITREMLGIIGKYF